MGRAARQQGSFRSAISNRVIEAFDWLHFRANYLAGARYAALLVFDSVPLWKGNAQHHKTVVVLVKPFAALPIDLVGLSAMYVVKRSGKRESVHFDKITSRVSKLCYGLDSKVRLILMSSSSMADVPVSGGARFETTTPPEDVEARHRIPSNDAHLSPNLLALSLARGAGDHLPEGHSRGVSWGYDLRAR